MTQDNRILMTGLHVPTAVIEKLEFDKVLALLAQECLGDLARAAALSLPIHNDTRFIEQLLTEAVEAKMSISTGDRLPMASIEDIQEDLRFLSVDGYVLSVEQLQKIHTQLQLMAGLRKFFNLSRQQLYPALFEHVRREPWSDELPALIGAVLGDDGQIRQDASPELQKIRARMASTQRELDAVFKQVLGKYKQLDLLADQVETWRNGRRVLGVPVENKRRIRGILHDESATGRTAFIEPEETITLNNLMLELEADEHREIYRLLRNLSDQLRTHIPTIESWQNCLTYLDLAYARGKLAHRMGACKPRIRPTTCIGIKAGRHPLLLLKNKKFGKKTVPFDLILFQGVRIVVISGPNAGGKSVTMKAVGLMQLMLQAGLPVPVHEISEFGVFNSFFADIGDSQSLEDDLSTYSSRLKIAQQMVLEADGDSLVLIDEFGAGTDPQIGGAIAEAILEALHRKKVHAVITTHYANLKIFAFKTAGMINASMFFDRTHLKPTYELKVGRPGSSYAFEIAEKIGLPKEIMKYVERRLGKTEKAVDQMLIELQEKTKQTEEQLAVLEQKQKTLDTLMKNYEQLQKDLERQRKQLKLDAIRQQQELTAAQNRELENVIRQIREEQNLERAKILAEQAKEKKRALEKEAQTLEDVVASLDLDLQTTRLGVDSQPQWQVGDTVLLRSNRGLAIIESISKQDAVVTVGGLRVNVKLRDLLPTDAKVEAAKPKTETHLVDKAAAFQPELDIRGVVPSDAVRLVENFVDNALVSGITQLRIVHGKGTGVMRNVVKSTLKEYKDMLKFHHPEPQAGGDGVTVVEIQ